MLRRLVFLILAAAAIAGTSSASQPYPLCYPCPKEAR